jgi:hypothetical protein
MSEVQSLQTVRQVYRAFTEGNLTGILKPLASDVDWQIVGRYEKVPWPAVWHGPQELER